MNAVISECGKYRYILSRDLSISLYKKAEKKICCFVMLNPSTADASKDDPTIRKCMKFADREGCSQLLVVNLYPFRATDPKTMLESNDRFGGLTNANWIHKALCEADLIICGWGNHAEEKAVEVFKSILEDPQIERPKCFAINKNGSPKHPLYVKDDTPLIDWESK